MAVNQCSYFKLTGRGPMTVKGKVKEFIKIFNQDLPAVIIASSFAVGLRGKLLRVAIIQVSTGIASIKIFV